MNKPLIAIRETELTLDQFQKELDTNGKVQFF